MSVRWVSDGCQMGVRWVSDVYLGVVREDAVLDQGGPGHEEDTILGRLDHLHKPCQMGVSDGCQMGVRWVSAVDLTGCHGQLRGNPLDTDIVLAYNEIRR